MPLSLEVHDILLRVFTIKPEMRIDIKDFKAAIQNVRSFSIPAARQTEYYEYQRAAWRAIALPAPAYPLVLAPAHKIGDIITRPPGVARVNRPCPPSSDNLNYAIGSDTFHETGPSQSKDIFSSEGLLKHMYAISNIFIGMYLTISLGPVKPKMQAVPESEKSEIHFINPLRNHTLGIAHPATESVSFIAHGTSPDKPAPHSWQSILDAMNAW